MSAVAPNVARVRPMIANAKEQDDGRTDGGAASPDGPASRREHLMRRCYDVSMRTTLDIDPVVLSAARAKAAAERISLGAAVSALARAGLTRRADGSSRSGFPVLRGAPGHVVTDELVREHRDDDAA